MTPTVREEDSEEGVFSPHAYAPGAIIERNLSQTKATTPPRQVGDWASHVPVGLFTVSQVMSKVTENASMTPAAAEIATPSAEESDNESEDGENKSFNAEKVEKF